MKRQYLVRIDKDVDSDWGASVPDLPGCVATGKTTDAALRRIEGAIDFGSTTHLGGQVVGSREGVAPGPPVRLLARNEPPRLVLRGVRRPRHDDLPILP